jgi:hypothetical protein
MSADEGKGEGEMARPRTRPRHRRGRAFGAEAQARWCGQGYGKGPTVRLRPTTRHGGTLQSYADGEVDGVDRVGEAEASHNVEGGGRR